MENVSGSWIPRIDAERTCGSAAGVRKGWKSTGGEELRRRHFSPELRSGVIPALQGSRPSVEALGSFTASRQRLCAAPVGLGCSGVVWRRRRRPLLRRRGCGVAAARFGAARGGVCGARGRPGRLKERFRGSRKGLWQGVARDHGCDLGAVVAGVLKEEGSPDVWGRLRSDSKAPTGGCAAFKRGRMTCGPSDQWKEERSAREVWVRC